MGACGENKEAEHGCIWREQGSAASHETRKLSMGVFALHHTLNHHCQSPIQCMANSVPFTTHSITGAV